MTILYTVQLVPLAVMYAGPPTLQLYARDTGDTVGSAVGSPITGVVTADVSVWTFDMTSVAVGYYFGQISGVSNPDAAAYPMYRSATGVYDSGQWWQIDAIVDGLVPVATVGTEPLPIIIGDDYLAANNRAFEWTIPAITGYVAATSTCTFGGRRKTDTWLVTGTITDLGGNSWLLSFDVARTDTEGLSEGYYEWSVEVRNAGGTEITKARSGRNALLLDKQT